jgi:sigma-B regulation protein RsbU (phosphoserine phosphatase)
MDTAVVYQSDGRIRSQLLDRRERLERVIDQRPPAADAQPLERLLEEVDQALARLEGGTFGVCEVCHGTIEGDRLETDPMLRTCLECLTAAEQRALESDLDLAARVQRGLLPPPRLSLGGWEAAYRYEPAGTAGGDYVDLLPLDSGDLIFLVGDVSGKGVAASLLMTHLHAIVRSLMDLQVPFAALAERVNRIFYETVGGQQYVTLVCGKASPDGELELSNAGHWPPVILRGGTSLTVPATSVPIGLFANAPFPTIRTTLEPGQSVVVYTDGVTETVDGSEREYGIDRVLRTLCGQHQREVHDLLAACAADVARFRGDARRRDDLTLFALRRNAPSGAGL